MKYLLLLAAVFIGAYGQGTMCDCELGVYLKNVNGKCSGEVKHFDTPEFGLGCLTILNDIGDSVQVDACTLKGLNVTLFHDTACTKVRLVEYLPTGVCHDVNADNHTFAIMTQCGETR
eukprot:CAMPEP_0197054614 /NCGR_PEP_ID=MMETSP1384-20130603/45733_1 /TAXON_ID=29189 /ORGANISM="Ammonia sp." /LENGTH=117 /DNA_ID=CAMNT_0042487855 /DNA_START=110 /DNA_END=463 /DNA_ORIENTATION=+